MTDAEHYRKLERLYTTAPVSEWYGAGITISDGQAEVGFAIVWTVSFTVHFARPVTSRRLRAVGRFLHGSGRLFLAESDAFDDEGQLLARGSGVFGRSSIRLDSSIGYA